MGNFHKIISSLIITILFIPLVFMGANVFFPKFDSYNEFKPCYPPRPTGLTAERSIEFDEENRKCMEESEAKRKVWQEEKNQYDSWKYIFIVAVCLVALLAALFIRLCFFVYKGSGNAGGKTIINVNDGNAGGTAIEHRQKCCDSAETGTIADACRHGDYRTTDQASHDACQCTFHSRYDNNDVSVLQLRKIIQQPVQAGHADIANQFRPLAHNLGGNLCFGSNG